MKKLFFVLSLILLISCNKENVQPNVPNVKRQIGVCDIDIASKWNYAGRYANGYISVGNSYEYQVIDTTYIGGFQAFKVRVISNNDTTYFVQRTDSLGTYKYFGNSFEYIKHPVQLNDTFTSGNRLFVVANTDTLINGYSNCIFYKSVTDSMTYNCYYQMNTGMVFQLITIPRSYGNDTIELSLTQRW